MIRHRLAPVVANREGGKELSVIATDEPRFPVTPEGVPLGFQLPSGRLSRPYYQWDRFGFECFATRLRQCFQNLR